MCLRKGHISRECHSHAKCLWRQAPHQHLLTERRPLQCCFICADTINQPLKSRSTESQGCRVANGTTHAECEVEESQSSNTSSGTSTEVVSLLSRLRSPTSSDLEWKRKIVSNPPPTGKRRSRGTTENEPKNIQLYQCVKSLLVSI